MDKPSNRPSGTAPEKPQNQTDEDHGAVTSQQVTDRNMAEKDLARGSEVEARRRGG